MASRPPSIEALDIMCKVLKDWAIVDITDRTECERLATYTAQIAIESKITPLASFSVEYEPRCLAISPSGKRLAVGTKSGDVRFFHHEDYDDSTLLNCWREHLPRDSDLFVDQNERPHGSAEDAGPYEAGNGRSHGEANGNGPAVAIRGMAFIDEDELIIGRGTATFCALRMEGGIWRYIQTIQTVPDTADRIRKIVAIPESMQLDFIGTVDAPPPTVQRAIAICMTHWGRKYVICRTGPRSYCAVESSFLRPWLIDAETIGGKLVIFQPRTATSASPNDTRARVTSKLGNARHFLTTPDAPKQVIIGRVKYVASSGDILAVINGDSITPATIDGPIIKLGVHREPWLLPDRPLAVCRGSARDEMWVIGVNDRGGLVARPLSLKVAMPDQQHQDPKNVASLPKGFFRASESAYNRNLNIDIALNVPCVTPLHMAVIQQDRGAADYRTFLVIATREHKVHVAQLLSSRLYETVFRHIPDAIKAQPEVNIGDHRHLYAQVVQRLLRQQFGLTLSSFFLEKEPCKSDSSIEPEASELKKEFQAAKENLPRGAHPSDQLEFITRGITSKTIVALADALPKIATYAWLNYQDDCYAEHRAKFEERMLHWVYVILHRISELAEDEQPNVRARVVPRLLELGDLGSVQGYALADFIRKWVKYGNSYAQKIHNVRQLYEWNKVGNRRLDSCTYGARLIRQRVDRLTTVNFSTGSSNNAIRSIAAVEISSPNGETVSLIIAAHHDGRLTGSCGDMGMVMELPQEFSVGEGHRPDISIRCVAALANSATVVVALSIGATQPAVLEVEYRPIWKSEQLIALEANQRAFWSVPFHFEPQALCFLTDSLAYAPIGFCVGTDGSQRQPFCVVHLALGTQTSVNWNSPTVSFTAEASPPPTNPTQALVYKRSFDTERIFAGFQDGRLVVFELAANRTYAELCEMFVGSPITCLAVWSEAGNNARGTIVGFGTASGQVGAVLLNERAFHEARLVHTLENASIVYIDFFDNGLMLAGASNGRVQIFSFKPESKDDNNGQHRHLSGSRIDRFDLGVEPRAMTIQQKSGQATQLIVGTQGGEVIRFSLAYIRSTPARRALFAEVCGLLFLELDAAQTPPRLNPWSLTTLLTGGDKPAEDGNSPLSSRLRSGFRWLRVIEPGVDSLRRLSLHLELAVIHQDAYRRGLRESAEENGTAEWDWERYYKYLDLLFHEIRRRRPLDKDLAKIIWEESSKFISGRLAKELESDNTEGFRNELDAYIIVVKKIEDYRWTWVDQDRGVEAKTLMHSFQCTFRWPLLVALADNELAGDDVRQFVINQLVSRRLNDRSLIATLEALRVINAAMLSAYEFLRCRKSWDDARLRLRKSISTPSFIDLMRMVGRSAYDRRDMIHVTHPLFTEVARFFALSLLLFTDSSLAVGLIVSESRLVERKTVIAGYIAAHADNLLDRIEREWQYPTPPSAAERVKLFKIYLHARFNSTIGGSPSLNSTDDRNDEPESAGVAPGQGVNGASTGVTWIEFTDQNIALEYNAIVAFLHEHLRDVSANMLTTLGAKQESMAGLRQSLLRITPNIQFLNHSRDYILDEMIPAYCDIVKSCATDTESRQWIVKACEICDQARERLQALDRLFEPQKGAFSEIYLDWRRQLDEQRDPSRATLELARRYSRHIYRPSIDALMARVTQVVQRKRPIIAPILPRDAHPTMREQLLEDTMTDLPLHRLVEQTTRFVDHVQLNALLVDIASHSGPRGAFSDARTSFSHVLSHFRDWGRLHGVDVRVHDNSGTYYCAGLSAFWSAVAQEFSRNVANHLGARGGRGKLEALVFSSKHCFCVVPDAELCVLDVLDIKPKNLERAHVRTVFEQRRRSKAGGFGLELLTQLAAVCGLEIQFEILRVNELEEFAKPTPNLSPTLENSSSPEELPQLAFRVSWNTGTSVRSQGPQGET